MPLSEDYLGVYQQFGVVQQAYSPESRRIGYDTDGTIIANEMLGAWKKFTNTDLVTLNSETIGFPVTGVAMGIPLSGSLSEVEYRTGYIYVVFTELKTISGVWMSLSPTNTSGSSVEIVTEGSFIDYGYLHDPKGTMPSVEFSTDATYNETTGQVVGKWSAAPSDFNAKVFRGEKTGQTGSFTYTALTHSLPSFLLDVQISNPLECLALKIPYQLGSGTSNYLKLNAIHLYGDNWLDDSEKRVVAFVDSTGTELHKDVNFGMLPKNEEGIWGLDNLNQGSSCYVKNITDHKTLNGVALYVDDTSDDGFLNDLDLSFDGEEWEASLDLGDLEPGDMVGPIYVRLRPESSNIGLRASRLRLTVEEVE